MRSMLRGITSHATVAMALASALAVGSAACKKDSASGGGGSAADAADLALLPAESMVVAGFNMKQLQSSAMYKQYAEPQLMAADVQKQVAAVKAKCGFDPLQAVTSVSIGAKGLTGQTLDAIVVLHGFEKAKSLACLDKMQPELAAQGVSFTKDGEVVTFTKEGQPSVLTFANDTTAVLGSGSYANAAAVKAAAAGTSTLKSSAAFVDMFSKLDTSKSIWFFVNGKMSAFDAAEGFIGTRPKSFFGSVNIADGLAIDARIRVDSAGKAAELAKTFGGQLDGLKSMANQAAMTSEGPDVRLTVAMSPAQLKTLGEKMGPMLGMLMGGM